MKYAVAMFLSSFSIAAREAPAASPVLNYIETRLPKSGVLKRTDEFVYVDVDDAYIHQLIPLIQDQGFVEPPYFGDNLVGAHITVIYPDEMLKYQIGEMEELGKEIPFSSKECVVVKPIKLPVDEVYFVTVNAPQLDQFRAKHGLPKREYDFHITIGVKP